jgi:hypothetical protein
MTLKQAATYNNSVEVDKAYQKALADGRSVFTVQICEYYNHAEQRAIVCWATYKICKNGFMRVETSLPIKITK